MGEMVLFLGQGGVDMCWKKILVNIDGCVWLP